MLTYNIYVIHDIENKVKVSYLIGPVHPSFRPRCRIATRLCDVGDPSGVLTAGGVTEITSSVAGGDPVAILGMFGQVFLPAVLLAAITAGVASCRVVCTLMTGQTGPVTQRFSADIANVHGCDWRWFEVCVVATPWRPVCVSYYDVIDGSAYCCVNTLSWLPIVLTGWTE